MSNPRKPQTQPTTQDELALKAHKIDLENKLAVLQGKTNWIQFSSSSADDRNTTCIISGKLCERITPALTRAIQAELVVLQLLIDNTGKTL